MIKLFKNFWRERERGGHIVQLKAMYIQAHNRTSQQQNENQKGYKFHVIIAGRKAGIGT